MAPATRPHRLRTVFSHTIGIQRDNLQWPLLCDVGIAVILAKQKVATIGTGREL